MAPRNSSMYRFFSYLQQLHSFTRSTRDHVPAWYIYMPMYILLYKIHQLGQVPTLLSSITAGCSHVRRVTYVQKHNRRVFPNTAVFVVRVFPFLYGNIVCETRPKRGVLCCVLLHGLRRCLCLRTAAYIYTCSSKCG